MNYPDTLSYLYNQTPMFQRVGGAAYKAGLDTTHLLDAHWGHPHRRFRSIHVAGTNGKGSVSHTLAGILQSAGYKVGLYTSPHLLDFRERIRVNGEPISEAYVTRFVESGRAFFEPLHPSFFELTTAMAFNYFAESGVDVAVVEVGLGGRLDCTNVISPDLCVITNISPDHVQFLGDTLEQIAAEKAGIIKRHTPVVVGETTPETRPVFQAKAEREEAPIRYAGEQPSACGITVECQLKGIYQQKNTQTILTAVDCLRQIGWRIDDQAVRNGFAHVVELTGIMGRWQILRQQPAVVCDTGHNTGGIAYVVEQLRQQPFRTLRMVVGMVNDKDIDGVLALLPKEAHYYFTQASVARALPCEDLRDKAERHGLRGRCHASVEQAVGAAMKESLPEDFIFVGGSNFIVADLLSAWDRLNA